MYVKVHKKANQWYRDDTSTLVGTEISPYSKFYRNLLNRTTHKTFIENSSNKIITVYAGYFDKFGKFRRLKENDICGDKSLGTYIFVLD